MIKFIKNILATIWLIGWALIFRWAGKNDFAPEDKAEGIRSIEGIEQ
ncbi:hypothetical protein LCGC14_0621910 [marine sediment metagenome]|uniref:Uncharacterized protein n=1 Tax=marine sediment metagenome TaxID=412755 RepID=A0A0F9R9I8_9ZZZZ